MKVLVTMIHGNKPWNVMLNFEDVADIEYPDDMTYHSYMVRQSYKSLFEGGIRESIFIIDLEFEDQPLLEFLDDTGVYKRYEGVLDEL